MSIPQPSAENTDFVRRVLENQVAALREDRQVVRNRDENDRVVFIVEPRKHEFLELVIRNAFAFLEKDKWNLHVFCGTENEDYVRGILPGWDFKVTNLGIQNLTPDLHNMLLLRTSFWNNIREENVLVIQTDVVMLRPGVERYMQYDFIGAPYLNPYEQANSGKGLNGGFSFRKRSVMLECLDKVDMTAITEARNGAGREALPSVTLFGKVAEDVFFNAALELLGKHLPSVEVASEFSSEAVYNKDSIGMHAFNKKFWAHELLLEMVKSSALGKYV